MESVRIAYFVHGRGRGHASRALSIVPALRALGATVDLYGSAQAIPAMAPLGHVHQRTCITPGPTGWMHLLRRGTWEEPAEFRATSPDLVISDGDQPALLAATAVGIPSIAIGHDLVFSCCAMPAGLARRHLIHQRVNAAIARTASTLRIAVHFTPLNVQDPNCRLARPDLVLPERPPPRQTGHVVSYFRDDNHATVTAMLQNSDFSLEAFGAGQAKAGQSQTTDRETFRSKISTAVAVVGSAGSNLIAECILTQTPLLALYQKGDAEQALNAKLLEDSGAGMSCAIGSLCQSYLDTFLDRSVAHSFARIDLVSALPSVVDATLEACRKLIHR